MSSGATKTCFINYTRVRILWATLEPRDYSTHCDKNQYLRETVYRYFIIKDLIQNRSNENNA
jgi:hypothetical protein